MNLANLAIVLVVSFIYIWTLYSVPILGKGIRNLHKNKNTKKIFGSIAELPRISVIVPVKNEQNVVGRLLSSLLNTNYPEDKREIVVVEDGSADDTVSICENLARDYPGQLKIVCRNVSDGKPSALVEGLKHVSGEIIGVFDADNVVEKDALLRVAQSFRDSDVVAVQGRVSAINAEENMLTQLIAHEETFRYDGFCRGKDAFGLFVPFMGSNYFVKREVLEGVGGWDSSVLSEDMELSVKLIHNGKKVKYVPDVRSWQEYPDSLMSFFKQRIRWWRGAMEVGFKYGKLMTKINRLSLDTELTLVGSFVFISYLMGYFIAVLSLFVPLQLDFVTLFLANFATVFTVVLLSFAGVVMIYTSKPRRFRNVLYMPLLYVYWVVLNFVASYALLQIVFRRPKIWNKTDKHGIIANSSFTSENGKANV